MENLICHFCKKTISEDELCVVDIKANTPDGSKDILTRDAHQKCAFDTILKLAEKTPFSKEDLETKTIVTCTEENECAMCGRKTHFAEYVSSKYVCSNECYHEVKRSDG